MQNNTNLKTSFVRKLVTKMQNGGVCDTIVEVYGGKDYWEKKTVKEVEGILKTNFPSILELEDGQYTQIDKKDGKYYLKNVRVYKNNTQGFFSKKIRYDIILTTSIFTIAKQN